MLAEHFTVIPKQQQQQQQQEKSTKREEAKMKNDFAHHVANVSTRKVIRQKSRQEKR